MNWIDISLAGFIGAISALIAQLFVRNPKEKRVAFAILMIFTFVILNSVSTKFLRPGINAWYYQKQIQKSLLEIAAYKEISKYDPELFQLIKNEINVSTKSGESESQTITRIRTVISQGASKYIPLASDNALIAFAKVMIDTLKQLTSKDPLLSYKFLFPKQYGTISVGKYISQETQDALLDTLAAVIRTGASNPIVIDDYSEAEALLEKVRSILFKTYGDELFVLANFHSSDVDKKRACHFMIDLYEEILKLPKHETCLVLRYVLWEE